MRNALYLTWVLLISSVQWISHVRLFVTPWTAAHQASLSITKSWSLLKLMSIESVMPSNHLILCRPLFLLPSIFPSIRIFPNESFLPIWWPKYWSFSFSISPSNEYSGLTSFRIDWFDFLAGWRMDWSNLSHGLVKIKMILFMLQKHNFQEMLTPWKKSYDQSR